MLSEFSAEEIQSGLQLTEMNEEIIQATAAIGNFPKEILYYARSRCCQVISASYFNAFFVVYSSTE